MFASQASGGLDVRVPAELYAMAVSEDEITCVDSISVEEEASQQEKDIPSLALVRVEAGTDLWLLAKQYHSTMESVTDNRFLGKIFVLTGTLEGYTRDKAEELIESFGGKTSGSVSKNTSYVLAGETPGSKLTKAQKLGIDIINEQQFREMIQ